MYIPLLNMDSVLTLSYIEYVPHSYVVDGQGHDVKNEYSYGPWDTEHSCIGHEHVQLMHWHLRVRIPVCMQDNMVPTVVACAVDLHQLKTWPPHRGITLCSTWWVQVPSSMHNAVTSPARACTMDPHLPHKSVFKNGTSKKFIKTIKWSMFVKIHKVK